MTTTQAQILELFQTLPEAEKRELAEQLYEQTVRGSFYDEADRGEGAEVVRRH